MLPEQHDGLADAALDQLVLAAQIAVRRHRADVELGGQRPGFFYSRSGNPTVRELELMLAGLQRRDDALACASGVNAVAQALFALTSAGDHVICFAETYTPTRQIIRRFLARFGVRHTLLSVDDLAGLERTLAAEPTRLVFFESPTNPVTKVAQWKVPMLIVHGQLDYRIPVEQGIAAFTALQRRGIESRFLYFPDENHWILKPANSILWHDTVNAWLAKNELGENVQVRFKNGKITGAIILELPDDFPVLAGQKIKASLALVAHLNDASRDLALLVDDVTVGGMPLPNAWVGDIKGLNLVDETAHKDPAMEKFLKGIRQFEIQDGLAVVKLNE